MPAITLPFGLSFDNWTRQLIKDLPNLITPNVASEEKNWREWARLLIQINALDVPIPTDQLFLGENGWRDWVLLSLPILEYQT